MPLTRLARADSLRRVALSLLSLGLFAALLLAAASPADAVTRKQATKKALAALGPAKAGERVVVFRLPKPLKAGTVITQRGAKKRVAKVGRERAYFFYRDSGPGQPYPHAGRVALVGAKKGKVKLSGGIMWQPLIDGRLPVFLRTTTSNAEYIVLDESADTTTPAQPEDSPLAPQIAEDDPFAPTDGTKDSAPKADSQTARAKMNSSKRITLTGTDEDGDLLTFFITKAPRNGTLSGQPPDVTYTPNPGFLGNDSFHFKVSDGDHESSNAGVVQIDVVPPGPAPVVTASLGCTAYTEQSPAVAVDGQLTVTDLDDTTLDSARVRVDLSDQPADDPDDPIGVRLGDELVFTDQNGISGSYNERTATLDLTGTASVAAYQAALRSVRYRNLSNPNPPPTRNVVFTANDSGNNSSPVTKQVCITGGAGGNDRPIGETNSEGALSYIENDGKIPIDGSFLVADPDSATLSGAYVKFLPYESRSGVDDEGNPTSGEGDPIPGSEMDTFDPAQDELVFQNQNGISGHYEDSTGVLTLTGTASVAHYQAALQSVAYENVSEDPTADPRRVELRVTDSGGANSIPAHRDIFVTPVNDAPVTTASAGSTDYTGSATVIDSGITAIDVDDDDLESAQVRIAGGFTGGDTLALGDAGDITGIYDPESGVLNLSGTAPKAAYQAALRTVTFDTTAQSGDRSIEFTTNDGELDSAATAKHVEINDPPVLDPTDEALAYTENDGPVALDSAITATDVDSATLSQATVTISSGYVAGEDVLAFTNTEKITHSLDETGDTLTLTGEASVAEYEAALQSITYENTSENPSTATRTVTFKADDGGVINSQSDAYTRDIAVTATNDAPVVDASDGTTAYTEGDAATAVDSAVTVADVDNDDVGGATVSITSGFQDGDTLGFDDTAEIDGEYDSGTGVLTLTGSTSKENFEAALRSVTYSHGGDDPDAAKTVTFSVSDGELSGSDTRDLAVTAVNDAPVLDPSDDALDYTAGDGAVALDSGIAVTDVDSDTLSEATVTISSGYVAGEDVLAFTNTEKITHSFDETGDTLTLTGEATVGEYQDALQSITYTNAAETPTTGTRTVTFKARDSENGQSDAYTREITISEPNQAPVVTTQASGGTYVIGDQTPMTIDDGITVADGDDDDLVSATVTISDGFDPSDVLHFDDTATPQISAGYDPDNGILTLTGPDSVAAFQAALRSVGFSTTGATGSRTVDFKVNDGEVDSNTSSVSFEVVPSA